MNATALDPVSMLRPRRRIEGISAILLPFLDNGEVDWKGFEAHVARTYAAGLIPAVNMDTGFGNIIDDATRLGVLDRTRQVLGAGVFVAGVFVADQPGATFHYDAYARGMTEIQNRGGIPVIFQSYGLAHQKDDLIVANYRQIATLANEWIAFELGTMFAPFGALYSLEVYRELVQMKSCRGAKHSSLRRDMEWERLKIRDSVRPEFRVYTGNDLAIDMVMYGSDYLLGLSTFAPDAFARRDAFWAQGDPRFYEWNDLLQYLGFLAFRPPVPAYKHSAAMFLKRRGWIGCDRTHPRSPSRPESDGPILQDIAQRVMDRLRNESV